MTWRSVAAFIAAPLSAIVVMAPLLANDALAQRHHRDRDADYGRGYDERDRGEAEWKRLGSRRIGGFGIDRDTIDVGRREGRFTRIGVEVRKGSVFLVQIVVVYGNNQVERFRMLRRLREGERTAPIDLKGKGRFIKRIEIAARARGRRGRHRHRAVLDVFGEELPPWNDGWEELGEKRVSRRVDRDTIRVGREEGRFAKIALEVEDNDVEIRDLKVFYRHGPPQDVRVREFIPAGGHTRPLDLRGHGRVIERIELVYRTRGPGRGRATVTVYGLQAAGRPHRRPPRRASWEELGCQRVGFGADKDTIKVGRREGRFSAIRLRAKRSDVLLLSLRVVYEHGAPDDFDAETRLRAGDESRPFDLRGRRRAIKRIELVYSTIPSLRGAATLCADGRD